MKRGGAGFPKKTITLPNEECFIPEQLKGLVRGIESSYGPTRELLLIEALNKYAENKEQEALEAGIEIHLPRIKSTGELFKVREGGKVYCQGVGTTFVIRNQNEQMVNQYTGTVLNRDNTRSLIDNLIERKKLYGGWLLATVYQDDLELFKETMRRVPSELRKRSTDYNVMRTLIHRNEPGFLAEFLKVMKPDINWKPQDGQELIFEAMVEELRPTSSKEMTKLLLAHPNIDLTKSTDGDNVLHFLVSYPKDMLEDVLKRLQSKGQLASLINAKNNNAEETPLHVLVNTNSPVENIEILLKYGANVNAQNNEGFTPLMIATLTGLAKKLKEDGQIEKANELLKKSNEQAKVLLANGADRTLKNKDNQTALDLCKEHKCAFEDALTYQGGGRKGPPESATKYAVGTTKKGNDGRRWKVVQVKVKNKNVNRWVPVKSASKSRRKSKSASRQGRKGKVWYFDKGTHPYTALRKLFGGRYHEQIEKIIEKIDKGKVIGTSYRCKLSGRKISIELITTDKGDRIVHTIKLWGVCPKLKLGGTGVAGRITVKK